MTFQPPDRREGRLERKSRAWTARVLRTIGMARCLNCRRDFSHGSGDTCSASLSAAIAVYASRTRLRLTGRPSSLPMGR